MSYCEGGPRPCCVEHETFCWAGCGDPPKRVKRRGEFVGAFCRDCYSELVKGKIPNVIGSRQTNRMGAKARLRNMQDSA